VRRIRGTIVAVLLAAAAACTAQSEPDPRTITGAAAVIDGDTLEIGGERIRLAAIDAPEPLQLCWDRWNRNWPCGRRAATALADRIGGSQVTCTIDGSSRSGPAATCRVLGEDLAEWMVRSGWALADRMVSAAYGSVEEEAIDAELGVWSGGFTPPWLWHEMQEGEPRLPEPVD
jgi:endonuclease YncB( thermonuclease family)